VDGALFDGWFVATVLFAVGFETWGAGWEFTTGGGACVRTGAGALADGDGAVAVFAAETVAVDAGGAALLGAGLGSVAAGVCVGAVDGLDFSASDAGGGAVAARYLRKRSR